MAIARASVTAVEEARSISRSAFLATLLLRARCKRRDAQIRLGIACNTDLSKLAKYSVEVRIGSRVGASSSDVQVDVLLDQSCV
jgi:hypothetical protein